MAIALGGWSKRREKVLGDETTKEWRAGGWAVPWVPEGRQGAGRPERRQPVGQMLRPGAMEWWGRGREPVLVGQRQRASVMPGTERRPVFLEPGDGV